MVKLPFRFKDYLSDPKTFSLTKQDSLLGTIATFKKSTNPEEDADDQDGKDRAYLMTLELPSKRQKISDRETIQFEVAFPPRAQIEEARRQNNLTIGNKAEKDFALEVQESQEGNNKSKLKGQLK